MEKPTTPIYRNIVGVILIFVGMGLIIFDFFSPPVGELSNVTLVIFAKLIAIAGSLMNIKIKLPDK